MISQSVPSVPGEGKRALCESGGKEKGGGMDGGGCQGSCAIAAGDPGSAATRSCPETLARHVQHPRTVRA